MGINYTKNCIHDINNKKKKQKKMYGWNRIEKRLSHWVLQHRAIAFKKDWQGEYSQGSVIQTRHEMDITELMTLLSYLSSPKHALLFPHEAWSMGPLLEDAWIPSAAHIIQVFLNICRHIYHEGNSTVGFTKYATALSQWREGAMSY